MNRFVAGVVTLAVALLVLVCLGLAGSDGSDPGAPARGGEVDALLLVCNAYGANYNLIRDVMDEYGWNLTTVGVTPTVTQCFYGGPVTVDTLVTEIADLSSYEVLAIMPARGTGGNSHSQLLASPEAIALVHQAVEEGLLVVSYCGGARVLAAADVLQGVHVTGNASYLAEYEAAGAIFMGDAVPPVRDGNIITSVRNQIYARRSCEIMRTVIDSLTVARAQRDAGRSEAEKGGSR